jgi:hypothetical protein
MICSTELDYFVAGLAGAGAGAFTTRFVFCDADLPSYAAVTWIA